MFITFDLPAHLLPEARELGVIPQGIYIIDNLTSGSTRLVYVMPEWHDNIHLPAFMRKLRKDLDLSDYRIRWSDEGSFVMLFDVDLHTDEKYFLRLQSVVHEN